MDEAYQPFSSRSWMDEIRAHPAANAHVLLMRTLSKFGLAGVRIGYMLGAQALVHEIDKLRPPYNVSVLNAECALFALEHAEVFRAAGRADPRDSARCWWTRWPACRASRPSLARPTWCWCVCPMRNVCFDALKAQGILVKNVSKMHPLLTHCLRLTVGTPSENAQLIRALQTTL